MARSRTTLASVTAAALLAACAGPEPTQSRFEATGELIALSGGDAGARGACVTCHGLDGGGDGDLVPRLAGLDRGYLARQMENFASGQRRHPQMSWIADHIDWPARQKVGEFYSALPVPAGGVAVPRPEDCAAAELYHLGDPDRELPACATCHGHGGKGVGQGYPPLAAQPAPYLAAQLRAWRSGERYGDPLGVMTHVSRLLAEPELEPLAGYSSALRGASGSPGLPAECLPARRPDPRSGA